MKSFPGGWAALTRTLLHDMSIDRKIATNGVKLRLNVETVVRLEFGAMLGDEEAITAIWDSKGASGLVPCGLLCSCTNKLCHTDIERNIASLSERDPHVPDLSTHDVSKLGLRSDEDVWAMFDALEPLTPGDRSWWEHVTGLSSKPLDS